MPAKGHMGNPRHRRPIGAPDGKRLHPAAVNRSRGDILVVGGGLIGLSVAWRAAQRGARVVVLEAGAIGSGASHVAAGQPAPGAGGGGGGGGGGVVGASPPPPPRRAAGLDELRAAAG